MPLRVDSRSYNSDVLQAKMLTGYFCEVKVFSQTSSSNRPITGVSSLGAQSSTGAENAPTEVIQFGADEQRY